MANESPHVVDTSTMTVNTAATSTRREEVVDPASPPESRGPAGKPPRKRTLVGRLTELALFAAAVGALVYFRGVPKLKEDAEHLFELAKEQVVGKPAPVVEPVVPSLDFKHWDKLIGMTAKQRETIGMNIVEVQELKEPIRLELNGTTDYDQNSLAKVRPLFDARVQLVLKSTGQTVKKGDPLFELFSTDLLAAKNDCRSKYVQWDHDLKLLESRRPLVDKGAITQVAWAETQNAEKKSRVDYMQSREKLLVFTVTNVEIDALIAKLGDSSAVKFNEEESRGLARMTIKSPIDGVIVERNVVQGNSYDANDILMVISPLDHLWVWANIFEKDQTKLKLGLKVIAQFPYLNLTMHGEVESIENRVDAVTRSLRLRASVPNTSKNLKADMLVRVQLEIPALPGQTSIPRNALAAINGENCVFVQRADNPDKFERRLVEIDQETVDRVICRSGIKAGEKVVSNGSLILAQLYDDLGTLESGMPTP